MALVSTSVGRPATPGGTGPRPFRDAHRAGVRRLRLSSEGALVVAACALIVRATVHAKLNTDVFWQLAAGRWMLAHHAVIRSDVFSYTVHGHRWVAEEWGFEVLLAWMVDHLGPVAFWLVSGGATVGALVVSAGRWRRQGATNLWLGMLALTVTFSLVLGLAPRPQDLSYLFFACELYVLSLSRSRRGALVVLPVLFAIWANIHGSFLLGIAVLALEAAIAAARGPLERIAVHRSIGRARLVASRPMRLSDAAAVLVACAGACLANPRGPGLFAYALRVTASSRLGTLISEWQSPDFHDGLVLCAIGIPLLLALIALGAGRFNVEIFDLVLWLVLLFASLHAVRFTPYLGIAFGGLAAPWSASLRLGVRPGLVIGPAVLAFVALLSGGYVPPATAETSGSLSAPVAAAAWLAQRAGRTFSTYVWNDYLIALHLPVFVDGRTDLYFGTGILSAYMAVSSLEAPPDPVLARWDVRWVLWPANQPLSVYLATDPRWRLVRSFGPDEIFERVGG